jgi:hypothetical protein
MVKYITIIKTTKMVNASIIAARVQNKNITFLLDKKGRFGHAVVTAVFDMDGNNTLSIPRIAAIWEIADLVQMWELQYGKARVVAAGKLLKKEDTTVKAIVKERMSYANGLAEKYPNIPSFLREYAERMEQNLG